MLPARLRPLCAACCVAPLDMAFGGAAGALDALECDPEVRPQDDLFRHVNGRWLRDTPIPADKARWGVFEQLQDDIQLRLHALIETAVTATGHAGALSGDHETQQIGALYASFMDEPALEARAASPLAGLLAEVDALARPVQLAPLMARLARWGIPVPVVGFVRPDAGDASRYLPYLTQEGLGLPDRDYYLVATDPRLSAARLAYREHLARLLALAGLPDPQAQADAALALETALAEAQWSRVANRDQLATYHPMTPAALAARAPGLDWHGWLEAAGYGAATLVVVRQPDYLQALARLAGTRPLADWRAYLRARVLTAYAPWLSRAFVDERFDFTGHVLRGTPENLPRWQRATALVSESLGDALGRRYVAAHYPAAHQARMQALVAGLVAACRAAIDRLDWMSPATRREAQAKLTRLRLKIGHPAHWIDYRALDLRPDDLVGNVMRARAFEHDRQARKLGQPVDRDEWLMTPQTVNAYYDPSLNEIVFPASILQPPFFDANADDAANYGAIGAVIGHEISHGYDDQGSRYDADGALRDWWQPDDRARFTALGERLVAQYGRYEPLPGCPIDGALSLGENIADNAGLAIAWQAYQATLGGHEPPLVDGQSGAQRFFFGWARVWRAQARDAALLQQLKTGPHAPAEFRANGAVRNHAGFYASFGVTPGDALYLPPGERVAIW